MVEKYAGMGLLPGGNLTIETDEIKLYITKYEVSDSVQSEIIHLFDDEIATFESSFLNTNLTLSLIYFGTNPFLGSQY